MLGVDDFGAECTFRCSRSNAGLENLPGAHYPRPMDKVLGIVALLAIYFLVGRRLPARYHLIAVAAALALAVLVLAMESAGVWPEAWTR